MFQYIVLFEVVYKCFLVCVCKVRGDCVMSAWILKKFSVNCYLFSFWDRYWSMCYSVDPQVGFVALHICHILYFVLLVMFCRCGGCRRQLLVCSGNV